MPEPQRQVAPMSVREVAEQTLDGTLPYEETWRENAQNVVTLLETLWRVQFALDGWAVFREPQTYAVRHSGEMRDVLAWIAGALGEQEANHA